MVQADQSSSFQSMSTKLRDMMSIVQSDPAVDNVVGFTGATSGFGGSANNGSVIVSLKPISERPAVNHVIDRFAQSLRRSRADGCSWSPYKISARAADKAMQSINTRFRVRRRRRAVSLDPAPGPGSPT